MFQIPYFAINSKNNHVIYYGCSSYNYIVAIFLICYSFLAENFGGITEQTLGNDQVFTLCYILGQSVYKCFVFVCVCWILHRNCLQHSFYFMDSSTSFKGTLRIVVQIVAEEDLRKCCMLP